MTRYRVTLHVWVESPDEQSALCDAVRAATDDPKNRILRAKVPAVEEFGNHYIIEEA